MRRHVILAVLPALAACSSGGIPLLEDEVRAPGATAERTRVIREGRAALPDRMSEIRAERRAAASAPTRTVVADADLPPRLDETLPPPTVAPADFPGAEPAPFQPAPLPPAPQVAADDPYFAGAPGAPSAPRIGAPARVGAAPAAPLPTTASDAPFALRGDAAPAVPAVPAGQPAYPLDPVRAAPLTVDTAAPDLPSALPTAQAGQSEGLPDAYVPDPAGTLAAINDLRARYGAGPLRYDPALSAVALAHARDLAARGEVASTSSGGAGVLSRARAMGAEPALAGSLVAGGYADVASALATWRGDKAQRDRLLLAEADTLGLALVEDRRSPFRYYVEAIVAAQ